MQSGKVDWNRFRVSRWVVIPVVFMLLMLASTTLPVYFGVKNALAASENSLWTRAGVAAGIALYVAMIVCALHLAFRPYLLRFDDAGLWRASLFGRKFIFWRDVRRAYIKAFKGSLSLHLKAGGRFAVHVPLNEYIDAASLLEAIKRRIPVAIEDAHGLATKLIDG